MSTVEHGRTEGTADGRRPAGRRRAGSASGGRTGSSTGWPPGRPLVALVGVLALVLSACASGGDGGQGGSGSGQTVAAGSGSGDRAGGGASEPTSTSAAKSDEEVEMPDLVGMTEAEARQALSDLGLDTPTVSSRESFKAPGSVLEQVPSAGRVITGTVSLVVAEAVSAVPNFVGGKVADVRAWAEPRGIEVRAESKLAPDKTDGEVLEQVPAAGAQAAQELVIKVADVPQIVTLADIRPVDQSYYQVNDIQMNGTIYPQVGLLTGTQSKPFAAFDLSRDWASLEMTLGVSDKRGSDVAVQVEFVADGQVVRTEKVVFGATNDVVIDVTDVLRLEIKASQISGREETAVGFGDARLIGSASTVNAPSGSTSTTSG